MAKIQSFSLIKAIKEAVMFVPRAWAGAWLVLGLLETSILANVFFTPLPMVKIALCAGAVILLIMSLGALYRMAIFDSYAKAEGLGFGGVQWDAHEWHLIGAGLMVKLFNLFILAVCFIVFAVVFNAANAGEGYDTSLKALDHIIHHPKSVSDFVIIAISHLSFVLVMVLALKFVLYQAATIAEHQIVSLNALSYSTRQVVKLTTGLALILSPMFLILYFKGKLDNIGVKNLAEGSFDFAGGDCSIVVCAMMLTGILFILLPMIVGFLSSAYRQVMHLRAKA